MSAPHDPYGPLRLGDYRCLLAGGVLTSIGTGMQSVAVGWELYQRTGDPLTLGLVGLAQFLPVLLLALPAGQAADRWNRKHMFQAAQGLQALASLGLAALSWLDGPVPLMFLCLVLAGVARACSAPARSALLPQVVPGYLLPTAVAWNSSGWQIANVVGPALGGMLLGYVGPPAAVYWTAASCALACIALLTAVRPRPVERRASGRTLADLFAGVRFVWHTELLLAAITLDLFAVLLGGATALLPIYARDILAVGPTGLGWLQAAPALGALLMGLTLAHRPPLRRPGLALLGAVAGFGAATVAFGLSEDFYLSLGLLALLGALDNVSVVVRGTLMQVVTPDAMRGRVAAVNTVFISSSNELGAFESGVTASWWGPVAAVVVGGLGTLAIVALAARCWPRLLTLGPPHTMTPAKAEEAAQPG